VRVIVTGAGGQLGHDLVRLGPDAGVEVVGLDREALDLTDRTGGAIRDALGERGFDALVNCAAYTGVDAAEADREAAFAINARAAAALAAECAARGAWLVQISTDYVFDGRADRPYREEDPTAPLNVYGESKREGERLVLDAHPDGTYIVRTASLFGIAGARRAAEGRGGNFVETMIRRGRETGRLRVIDDIVMSPTGTADLARAILTLLTRGAPAGTYHVVNAGEASWYEFARAIIEDAGVDAAVEPVPSTEYRTAARRPAYSVLDTAKARSAGCELPHWRDALGRYLRG
jgi:dTDP-4-dehydrorhamnose reductase